MSSPLPDEVDVVVVGAGGAGMTAALAAAKDAHEKRPNRSGPGPDWAAAPLLSDYEVARGAGTAAPAASGQLLSV